MRFAVYKSEIELNRATCAIGASPQRILSPQHKTMQASTLVALLIPVVAIWITVVVRYGRSIEKVA